MKYAGMPIGMWMLFERSFRERLCDVLSYKKDEAILITQKAKKKYREIIKDLPEFEKKDRFKMNILSCAMYSSFCLNMEKLPAIEELSEYYEKAMMTKPMKLFCKNMGKLKFTEKDMKQMEETERRKDGDRNPYSWNMDLYPYEDGSGYEARFSKCGICTLMRELGLSEAIPAMCHLDYSMAEAGGVCDFIREHTLASGGPYCDCGYKKKVRL
jgi:hypothetical protein